MKGDPIEAQAVAGGMSAGRSAPASGVVRRSRGIPLLTMLALAALVGAGIWAWRANTSSDKPVMDMNMRISAGNAAFPVSTVAVERGPIAGRVVYTGTIVPFVEEDVFPRVTGRIVDMPVYPGDAVRPGQVVARLDDVELGSRVAEASAGAAAARANVAQMDADVTAARHGVAQMEREIAMAEAELAAAREGIAQMERELQMVEAEAGYQEQVSAREERLFGTGAVSRQDVENARAMVTAARAKVQAARAKVSQMRAMATAAQAKLEAARARLERERAMEASAVRKRDAMAAMATQSRAMQRTAEVVRDYVNIRTSAGGYVVKRLVSPGVLVEPGMAILKIAQIDRVRLQANVGEKDVAAIKVGSPVRVTAAGSDEPLVARVTSVFPFVDAGSRTAVVEAVVDNATRRFLPGQYVTMAFVTGEQAEALSVPRTAVARLGGQARVWIVTGDRAEPRNVMTGLESAERIQIQSGLDGSERIVARGHEGLYAGARIAEVKGSTEGPPAPVGHGDHGAAVRQGGATTTTPDRAGAKDTPAPPTEERGGSKHQGH